MWQVVRIARKVLAMPLVNIGGIDIVNGQHKLLLAILWQLMRYNIRCLLQASLPPEPHICLTHSAKVLSKEWPTTSQSECSHGLCCNLTVSAHVHVMKAQAVSSKGTKISDAELDREILTWANDRVAAAGKRRRITSFHDPSIASGLFLVRNITAAQSMHDTLCLYHGRTSGMYASICKVYFSSPEMPCTSDIVSINNSVICPCDMSNVQRGHFVSGPQECCHFAAAYGPV
jgi:hypothetical protein